MCKYDSIPAGFFAIGGTAPLHYQWSPSVAVSNDTIENTNIIADTATLLTVTVTDAVANSVTGTIYVNVNQPPSILSVQETTACISCSNGMFALTVSAGSAPIYYYTITPSAGAVITGDSIGHLAAGIYTICAHDFNGCSVCVTDTMHESGISVAEMENISARVFPNPSTGNITIVPGGQNHVVTVMIEDSFGRNVRSEMFIDKAEINLHLDGVNGLYIVRIIANSNNSVFRVVKLQ
jgi:hypothetical protein